MDKLDVDKVLQFIKLVNHLKHSPRRGWVNHSIANPESIAGHMYCMAMMTFLLGNDSKLDRLRCMQLALVHDLAESIVGDITPLDNVPVEVKHNLEKSAMKEITELLGGGFGNLIYNLYEEYEKKETDEAKFVKDLDRFDMIFTAYNYEERDKSHGKLQDFFDSTQGKFEHPLIKKLVTALESQREFSKQSET